MAYLNPNNLFVFSGSNLNFINAVKFGNLGVGNLSYMGSTGISGLVPAAAYTNDVRLVTSTGPRGTAGYSIGSLSVILRQADQIDVGPLPSISGRAGDIINITGENFYQLTTVKFGEVEGEFNTVDSQTVEVEVPLNADYAKVTVFSSLRTGIDNDQTIASGLSNDEFVPIPEVSGMNSSQLVSGSTLEITGFSLKGVTGVNFNNIITSATVVDTNSLTAVIPSGNTRGVPSLLLQSGGVSSFPSALPFNPLADVTGVGGAAGTTRTGDLIYISGDNFSTGILHKVGSKYLGAVMGQTGEFELITDKVMSGMVPAGIPIITSSGNLGAGVVPIISSGLVSLFSEQYPEAYPSEVYFTPEIGPPSVSSITPSSGIAGDVLAVKGSDLYAITGVNLLPSTLANVGIGTYQAGTLGEAIPGSQVNFEIGNAANLGTLGEYYDVVLSGFYGATTGVSGFFSLGVPSISSNTPSTNIVPGVTGLIEGSRLYSGTAVELYTGVGGVGSYKSHLTLPSSGYTSTHDRIEYTYPTSFLTGVNYRMIVRNRRSFDGLTDPNLDVLRSPHLSGFEPLSGEFGDTVTVSGYFENMIPSGLRVGLSRVDSFDQPGTTGFTFKIPDNSQSDTLSIATSGGSVFSTGVLAVRLSKPSISGFYGGTTAPSVIDYDQVFKLGDTLTISGERLDLVTGVEFSGQSGSFGINSFGAQSYSNLSLPMPPINPDSGVFRVRDFLSRTSSHDSGINFNIISGFTNDLLPGETMTLSGRNVSGMNVLFPSATGNNLFVSSANLSNSIDAQGVESITVNVPTGIVFGNLEITGRQNQIRMEGDIFTPIGVITGVSGFDSNLIAETGAYVSITGINCFDQRFTDNKISTYYSGRNYIVGISGSGVLGYIYGTPTVSSLPISKYVTGTATIGGVSDVFYSEIGVHLPRRLLSGALFTVDPWSNQKGNVNLNLLNNNYNDSVFWDGAPPFGYNSGIGASRLEKKISAFSNVHQISGNKIVVSGITPHRGSEGQHFELSGANLSQITRLTLTSIGSTDPNSLGNPLGQEMAYSGSSVSVTPAFGGFPSVGGVSYVLTGVTGLIGYVPTIMEGMYSLTYEGVPFGGAVDGFEVVPRTPTIQYDIITTGENVPISVPDTNVNYTMEEDVGGTVFLVTRTKFPDGSTVLISSIPKP